jgi:hypothetical protein
MLLDNLVLALAALIVGMNTPRTLVAPQIRARLEKTTDATERVFTDLACIPFGGLSPRQWLECP